MTVSGWLFDVYPSADKMVLWVKQKNGQAIRLEDNWTHSIFLAVNDQSDFAQVLQKEEIMAYVKSHEFVEKREKLTDIANSKVLKLTLHDSTKALKLARMIESLGRFGRFRLYNVDISPEQTYFYEHDLFSLAYCHVASKSSLDWQVNDKVESVDYAVPDFRNMQFDIKVRKEDKILKFTDRLDAILIQNEKENYEIRKDSEIETLKAFENEVAKIDPDFILTSGGDSFIFPYLVSRAETNGIELSLSREKTVLKRPNKDGTSYFSYGKIHFKPSATRLHGRVHIDRHHSFMTEETGLEGLYEVARLCRLPLHAAARASIGKCL
ncbi:MAG: hypothetical protein DA330_10935, partial [Nitrososphaera sp.]|nr:hypothetical protein [Nitrososphaera sp.]